MSQENAVIFERPLRMPVINALRKAVTTVLEQHLPQTEQQVLEVGCGDGFLYGLLPDPLKVNYNGFDINELSIARFRDSYPGVAARRGRIDKIPYIPNSMDAVLGFSAYSFVNNWAASVEMREVLKPGGRLILFQDSGLYLPKQPGKDRTTYDEMQQVETTHIEIRRNLKDAGFTFISGEDPIEAVVISPYQEALTRIPEDLLSQIPEGRIPFAFTSDTGINKLHTADPSEVAKKLEEVKKELGSPRILEPIKIRGRRQFMESVSLRFIVAEKQAS